MIETNRFTAFLIHLIISCIFVSLVFLIATEWLYPRVFFDIEAGWDLLKIIFMVDIVLGPLLTLSIFKKNKPKLKFDLAFIALIQISALSYGCHVLFNERPAYLVFMYDTFYVIKANGNTIDQSHLSPQFKRSWYTKPTLVYSQLPKSNELINASQKALAGKEKLYEKAEYWQAYERIQDQADIKKLARTAPELKKSNNHVEQYLSSMQSQKPLYYPVIGTKSIQTIAVNAQTFQPIAVISLFSL